MENKKLLSSKLEFLDSIAGVLSPLEQSLSIIKDTSEGDVKNKLDNELKNICSKRADIEKTRNDCKSKLKDIESNINFDVLQMPLFGRVDTPSAENLIAFCNHYSGLESECFNEFFCKVRAYSEHANLSEKGFKMVLSGLLKSEAFELFQNNKEKSASQIVKILANRFTNNIGILNYDLKLKNFKRNSTDNLTTCMQKVDNLIHKTSTLVPPDQRESRRNFLLTEHLLKVVDPTCRSKIRSAQLDSSREGINLHYDDMFKIALYNELDRCENSQSFLSNIVLADSAERSITQTLPSAETFLATPVNHDTFYDSDWENPQTPRDGFIAPREDYCYPSYSPRNESPSPRDDFYSSRGDCYSPREDSPAPWDDSGRPTPTPLPIHQSYYSEYEDGVDFQTVYERVLQKIPQLIQTEILNSQLDNPPYSPNM